MKRIRGFISKFHFEQFSVLWVIVAVPVLALVVNVILAEAQNSFGMINIIVAGAFIITFSIAILYCSAAVAANELLYIWYSHNTEAIRRANVTTAQIVAESESGTKFWRAGLADYFGMGGVVINYAIKPQEAANIVAKNDGGVNVFCITFNDAMLLIQMVTGDTFYVKPEAHRENGKILNMQHTHVLFPDGFHGFTHIFFAIPYMA